MKVSFTVSGLTQAPSKETSRSHSLLVDGRVGAASVCREEQNFSPSLRSGHPARISHWRDRARFCVGLPLAGRSSRMSSFEAPRAGSCITQRQPLRKQVFLRLSDQMLLVPEAHDGLHVFSWLCWYCGFPWVMRARLGLEACIVIDTYIIIRTRRCPKDCICG